MIVKLEEQLNLTKKTDSLLKGRTEEKEKQMKAIFDEFTFQIDKDMVEIVDYCIKANVSGGFYIPLATLDGDEYKDSLYKDCQIVFSYLPGLNGHWYIGCFDEINNRQRSVSFGTVYDIRRNKPYPKWKYPDWEQDGDFLHTRAFHANDISQYLYSNWSDLKEMLVDKICEQISEYNNNRLNRVFNLDNEFFDNEDERDEL